MAPPTASAYFSGSKAEFDPSLFLSFFSFAPCLVKNVIFDPVFFGAVNFLLLAFERTVSEFFRFKVALLKSPPTWAALPPLEDFGDVEIAEIALNRRRKKRTKVKGRR